MATFEESPLPSPQCKLADPEAFRSAVSGMYHGIFEAHTKPMLSHGKVHSHSSTRWQVRTDNFELRIFTDSDFNTPPTTKSLGNFAVTVKGADNKCAGFLAWREQDGSFSFENTPLPTNEHLSPKETELGQICLQAFLDGTSSFSVSQTNTRLANIILDNPHANITVKEERMWQDGDLAEITSELSMSRSSSENGFLFEALLRGSSAALKKYCDTRDYLGPFGINPDLLDLMPGINRLELSVPSTLRTRTPERLSQEEAIEASRYTLTAGRLKEVHTTGAKALHQLGQYHREYLAKNSPE